MKTACLALCLALSIPATAAEPPAPPVAVDPANIAAADRLLTAMDYEKLMTQTTEAMIAEMGPAMKKALETELDEPVDDELIRRITAVQATYLRSTLLNDPKLRRAIALLYARHFSVPELDRLSELYKDPVMQKWTEVAPRLMAELLPLMSGIASNEERDRLKDEIRKVVEDYFKEKGTSSES